MKLWKWAIFFNPRDRETENWKGGGGNFDNFFKTCKILTPVFEQEVRMFPCKIYRTRIEIAISALLECLGFFFFILQKMIKQIKLVTFVLNARLVLNFKNKSNRICIKKRKINHDPENRRTVNCNKTKLCISQRL